MSLDGKTDQDKLDSLCKFTYKDQAIWFLNAFWHKFGEAEAENVWKYKQKHDGLDMEKGKEGSQLDELQSHRFLESFGETLTVSKLREKLQAAGIDKNSKRKYIPLVHYLVIKYNADWHYLVNAPQGDNQKEVEQAQQMLAQVQKAFEEVQRLADAAKARESEARDAERSAKQREVEARDAKVELEAALAELKAQEDAFNARTQELKAKSETGSVVQMNKAKNELAQHLSTDPLPLRKAKITQEAAVKKAERTSKAAAEARAAAEDATRKAIQARADAEKAVEQVQRKVEEAEAFLEEVRKKPGTAAGALWWIDNELREARKYLPKSKGGLEK